MTSISKTEPEQVWRGDDVKMNDVLEALSKIRYEFARAEAGDNEHARPRNCVMTLVAVAADDAEERRAHRTCRLIGTQHPAQAIVIREDASQRGKRVDAWITTDVHRPEMACAVECEVLTLHVPGTVADHIDAIVDPLLVSGVPTYLWWMGTPPFGRHELMTALRICDALVFDSARFEEPYRAFQGLARLTTVAHRRLGLADLQWSRLRAWRESIAQFFMPTDRRGFLRGISEVGIDYVGRGRGNRIGCAFILGWMAAALGWKLQRAVAGAGGVVVAHYLAGGRIIEVHLRSMAKDHLVSGEVAAVRIGGTWQGSTFRLSVLRDPDRPPALDEAVYRTRHPAGGDDEAGVELAGRRAEWHRDVLHENVDWLHHSATGEAPGESRPKYPVVFTRERRRRDTTQVFLTMIEIGDSLPLRHVQQIEAEDEATLLLDLLATGTHDKVFNRSLLAAFELMRKL
jgi:glucose-6-phosphate dehydrogenase assembly protein OpcA